MIRRNILGRGDFDAFVVTDRDSTPYVTRLGVGGQWGVRVRTNTARRTATRAELLALAGGKRAKGGPVRRLDARVAPLGQSTQKIEVTNVGTVAVADIGLDLPDGAQTRPFEDREVHIELLNPGERAVIPIMGPSRNLGSGVTNERVTVRGTAEDGEPVVATVMLSNFD